MTKRTILVCGDWERIFTGRVREDGSMILSLDDSACRCGSEVFETVEGAGNEVPA
jgi:hypothetical protein